MSFLSFMDEDVATEHDSTVAAIVDALPKGDDQVGASFLWFAYLHQVAEPLSQEDFVAAVVATGRTIDRYGQPFVDGVDLAECRRRHLEAFRDLPAEQATAPA